MSHIWTKEKHIYSLFSGVVVVSFAYVFILQASDSSMIFVISELSSSGISNWEETSGAKFPRCLKWLGGSIWKKGMAIKMEEGGGFVFVC